MRPWEKKKVGTDYGNRVVRPTHDRVLVKLDKPKDFTGVIYVAINLAEEKAVARGEIVAVGPGKPHRKTGELVPLPKEYKPGVRVTFGKYAGTEILINGEMHRLMPSTDILALDPEETN